MTIIFGTKPAEHDATYVAIKDGQVLFIGEEERFNRVKHALTVSTGSLDWYTQNEGFSIDAADLVSCYVEPDLATGRKAAYEHAYGKDVSTDGEDIQIQTLKGYQRYLDLLAGMGVTGNRRVSVPHHICHAASAFYPSPFYKSAILSIDGGGEMETAVIGMGEGTDIRILDRIPFPHSLGHFYEQATEWLGYNPLSCAGKTMGLSSYGKPVFVEKIKKYLFNTEGDKGFRSIRPLYHHYGVPSWQSYFGPRRSPDESVMGYYADVAASVQLILEEAVLSLAEKAKRITGEERLCYAGGVALNSVANGKLETSGLFKDIYITPLANDAGTALGGGLWLLYNKAGYPRERKYWQMRHAYWGAEYSDDEIVSVLKKYDLPVNESDSIWDWTAEKLQAGNIIGWYQGRSEVGPRALGNRSIIADPSGPDTKDRVNIKVKNREPWRPFAPSVLEEDFSDYFEGTGPSPFMLKVFEVRPEKRRNIQATVHVDGTARVQTVSREDNPLYYKMIESFKKKTGISAVLNSSMNFRGEPVVNTPEEAVRLFLKTDMDILVMSRFYLEKSELMARATQPPDIHPVYSTIKRLPEDSDIILISEFDTTCFAALHDAAKLNGRSLSLLLMKDNHPFKGDVWYRESMLDNWRSVIERIRTSDRKISVLLAVDGHMFHTDAVFGDKVPVVYNELSLLRNKKELDIFFIQQNGAVITEKEALSVWHEILKPEKERCRTCGGETYYHLFEMQWPDKEGEQKEIRLCSGCGTVLLPEWNRPDKRTPVEGDLFHLLSLHKPSNGNGSFYEPYSRVAVCREKSIRNMTRFFKQENIRNVAIYGTSGLGPLLLELLEKDGGTNVHVDCFLDSFPHMWHRTIQNKRVLEPEEIVGRNVDAVLIASYGNQDDIYRNNQWMENHGIRLIRGFVSAKGVFDQPFLTNALGDRILTMSFLEKA